MTVYQQLQLNAAGSKKLLREAKGFSAKARCFAVYLCKVLMTLLFCVAFVLVYTKLFGSENSIVGVAVLLCILVFRFADLGIHVPHAQLSMLLIFAIYAVGPRAANVLGPVPGFFINLFCICLMLLLGCHDVIMSNHSTLVLNYLLLYGYDVTGEAFRMRLLALLLGALLTMAVYYHNHHEKTYRTGLREIMKAVDLHTERTRWQLAMSLTIASLLMVTAWFGLPRAVWAGIAAMSVMMPVKGEARRRALNRIPGNVIGGALFFLLVSLLPEKFVSMLGLLGGFCLGFSATYRWQSVFNAIGGMSVAVAMLGLPSTIFFRIFNNALGALYALAFGWLFNWLVDRFLGSRGRAEEAAS